MIKRVLFAVLLLAASSNARAQVADIIGGYSFDKENSCPAAIIQAYAPDRFGDTYARADFCANTAPFSLSTAYLEIARTLVFWPDSQFNWLGLHAEFNGYLNMDNCNCLFGVDYTLPIKDLVKVSLLYKTFNGGASSKLPVQLSALWDLKDLLGLKGLEFRGVFKVWGEETKYWYGDEKPLEHRPEHFIIRATPQLWYSAGQFFGWDGLSIGGELDLSYNYVGCSGLRVRPLAAIRVSF